MGYVRLTEDIAGDRGAIQTSAEAGADGDIASEPAVYGCGKHCVEFFQDSGFRSVVRGSSYGGKGVPVSLDFLFPGWRVIVKEGAGRKPRDPFIEGLGRVRRVLRVADGDKIKEHR